MSDRWSIQEIGDLHGKVVVVTGGNSGLGFEAVKVYAQKGATVVMAVRSTQRGEEAKSAVLKTTPKADIAIMALDLSSLKSVAQFAEAFKERFKRLDILMNNAGIMFVPYGLTEDGFERQMGINHLGHFALTAHLFDRIRTTPEARIVNISSLAHRSGEMDFDNFLFEGGKGYTEMAAYGRSKLANLLFTYELQRRVEAEGLDVKVLAAHPGGSKTNLGRNATDRWWFKVLYPVMLVLMQSAEKGSLPGIRASVDKGAKGGTYYGPKNMGEMRGRPVVVEATEAARSTEDAKALWQRSEELTGVTFKVK